MKCDENVQPVIRRPQSLHENLKVENLHERQLSDHRKNKYVGIKRRARRETQLQEKAQLCELVSFAERQAWLGCEVYTPGMAINESDKLLSDQRALWYMLGGWALE